MQLSRECLTEYCRMKRIVTTKEHHREIRNKVIGKFKDQVIKYLKL